MATFDSTFNQGGVGFVSRGSPAEPDLSTATAIEGVGQGIGTLIGAVREQNRQESLQEAERTFQEFGQTVGAVRQAARAGAEETSVGLNLAGVPEGVQQRVTQELDRAGNEFRRLFRQRQQRGSGFDTAVRIRAQQKLDELVAESPDLKPQFRRLARDILNFDPTGTETQIAMGGISGSAGSSAGVSEDPTIQIGDRQVSLDSMPKRVADAVTLAQASGQDPTQAFVQAKRVFDLQQRADAIKARKTIGQAEVSELNQLSSGLASTTIEQVFTSEQVESLEKKAGTFTPEGLQNLQQLLNTAQRNVEQTVIKNLRETQGVISPEQQQSILDNVESQFNNARERLGDRNFQKLMASNRKLLEDTTKILGIQTFPVLSVVSQVAPESPADFLQTIKEIGESETKLRVARSLLGPFSVFADASEAVGPDVGNKLTRMTEAMFQGTDLAEAGLNEDEIQGAGAVAVGHLSKRPSTSTEEKEKVNQERDKVLESLFNTEGTRKLGWEFLASKASVPEVANNRAMQQRAKNRLRSLEQDIKSTLPTVLENTRTDRIVFNEETNRFEFANDVLRTIPRPGTVGTDVNPQPTPQERKVIEQLNNYHRTVARHGPTLGLGSEAAINILRESRSRLEGQSPQPETSEEEGPSPSTPRRTRIRDRAEADEPTETTPPPTPARDELASPSRESVPQVQQDTESPQILINEGDDSLVRSIKNNEGLRLGVYTDTTGNPTIGFGHKLTPEEQRTLGPRITREEAEELLREDIEEARQGAQRLMEDRGVSLPREAEEVVTEMVFQMGETGVSQFNNMWNALQQNDFQEASREMLNSQWFQETPNRAKELAAKMRNVNP